MWMRSETFEDLVDQALAELPLRLAGYLDNVEVVVEDWPTSRHAESLGLARGETLYGLYEGVPLTERSAHYSLVMPDKITVFRGPILQAHRSVASVREQVRQTVIHELAHHFGIDDDRLIALDAY